MYFMSFELANKTENKLPLEYGVLMHHWSCDEGYKWYVVCARVSF